MAYWPFAINLQHHRCLVIGGGQVAARRIELLLNANAEVVILSPAPLAAGTDQLLTTFPERVRWKEGSFPAAAECSDLRSYKFVVAATGDAQCNQLVMDHCRAQGVLCNNTSNASSGDTIFPGVISEGGLTLSVHSDNASPALTRYYKRFLSSLLKLNNRNSVAWLAGRRDAVAKSFPQPSMRRRFWHRVINGLGLHHASGKEAPVSAVEFDRVLQQGLNGVGEVYLVGAGPGDPELLTVKALKLISTADIVLYDRLVSEAIMALLPGDCERVYVGKRRAEHAVPQPQINELLLDLARRGRNVLRLKGGDPFIFGRGGEEIQMLADAGVPFQVVPGITAASGCACYGGIPLTHRDFSQSVRFVTGHLKNDQVNLDWPELARPHQTLVFYMGLEGLEQICSTLIAHGLSESTPAALVEKGTTPEQRVIAADLQTLPQAVISNVVSAPTLLIVGEVVSLRDSLRWFD